MASLPCPLAPYCFLQDTAEECSIPDSACSSGSVCFRAPEPRFLRQRILMTTWSVLPVLPPVAPLPSLRGLTGQKEVARQGCTSRPPAPLPSTLQPWVLGRVCARHSFSSSCLGRVRARPPRAQEPESQQSVESRLGQAKLQSTALRATLPSPVSITLEARHPSLLSCRTLGDPNRPLLPLCPGRQWPQLPPPKRSFSRRRKNATYFRT